MRLVNKAENCRARAQMHPLFTISTHVERCMCNTNRKNAARPVRERVNYGAPLATFNYNQFRRSIPLIKNARKNNATITRGVHWQLIRLLWSCVAFFAPPLSIINLCIVLFCVYVRHCNLISLVLKNSSTSKTKSNASPRKQIIMYIILPSISRKLI